MTTYTDASKFTVKDAVRGYTFTGILIAEESTENQNSSRWLTLEIYRITEGDHTGQYILVATGHSVRYHVAGAPCSSGVLLAHSELFNVEPDAEPCHACNPSGQPGSMVNLEGPIPTVHRCETAREVIEHLHQQHDNAAPTLSRPATRLLLAAAQKDVAFAPSIEEL